MTNYVIVQASPESKVGFACYGNNRDFWRYRGLEVLLSGPFETGKTITALNKLHLLHAKYPGCQGLMVRKTYKSLLSTAVVTYEKKVLPYPPEDRRCPVDRFGGNRPEWYDYPNGSRLKLGGLDEPDRVLSAEYDLIYVNQAEEFTKTDWETLLSRVTGRAGNMPYSQLMGDCNPGPPTHWILFRETLKIFYSRHEDNPRLFDQSTGKITQAGEVSISVLDSLTGVRHSRGRLGLWVAAEGQVYDTFDPAEHLINRFEIPADWRRFRVIDFGFTNPFTCQWWAVDHDGRLYMYREMYFTRRLVEDHADEINRLTAGVERDIWQGLSDEDKRQRLAAGERIEDTITDHDAEDRATLERRGIYTTAAKKDIVSGLQAVTGRLKKAGDGKPRIFFMRDSLVEPDPDLKKRFKPLSVIDEFPVYVWATGKDGKPEKETPIDDNNHGLDCVRYIAMHLQESREIAFSPNPFYGEG